MQLSPAFIQSMQQVPGFNEASFTACHQEPALPVSIRYNPFKNQDAELFEHTAQVPWCPTGRYLQERPSFILDPCWHAGMYYVQEASSMFLQHALHHALQNDLSHKKVLDLCAAPGGKSTLLSALFEDGLVVSNEVIKSRLGVLYENMVKWGMPNNVITHNDAATFQKLPGFFDVLVIDAPCSGSGLFRRQPEAAAQWSKQQVLHCGMRQKKILADALPTLCDDGILIYSTCSFSYEENETIADWLCSDFDFESISIPVDPAWGIVVSVSQETKATCYRFYPDQVKGEGFFISIFRKKKGYTGSFSNAGYDLQALKDIKSFEAYIDPLFGGNFFLQGDLIRAVNSFTFENLPTVKQQLYITHAGINCGVMKKNDFIPHHGLAVSTIVEKRLPVYKADKEIALQYLRKQEIPAISGQGWQLVQYEGCNTGWIKVLPNRINNYYPTEWRILKT